MIELKDRLKLLGRNLKGRLEKAVIDDALEYIDFGEIPLAVETLCDQLYEYDVRLSAEEFSALYEIGIEVGAEMNRVTVLKSLVAGP